MSKGKPLEKALAEQCERLAIADRAFVARRTNPLRILRAVKGGLLCVPGPMEALDFEGTIAGGRHVVFDAKASKHPRHFPFDNVSDDQIDYAARHRALGAVAFLYVRSSTQKTDYVLPVDEFARIAQCPHKRSKTTSRGVEHISWTDAAPWRVLGEETWLDALIRLWNE